MSKVNKVVLASSGGLDTSASIPWLKEQYNCEVIAFCADVGQEEDMDEIREKSLRSGADKVIVEDLREEFVAEYVFSMLRANAVYEGGYLLGTSIARPLIAKKQIEAAKKFGADAVAHGATGKGNDQVRFELAYQAMMPAITIIAPWRIWSFQSRDDLFDYVASKNIEVSASRSKPYSIDRNLLHVSFEGGVLENTCNEPPEDLYERVVPPVKAPDVEKLIEIDFEHGDPVAIDGQKMPAAALLGELNKVGGDNGVGRIDFIENRFVGMKSRGIYETPGGTILLKARQALESITLDREVMHYKEEIALKYARLVYNGFWFSPERELLQVAVDATQKNVNGSVRMKLYKGNATPVGRVSPNTLYSKDLATFDKEEIYNQKHAEGFIRLNALRLGLGK